MENRPPVTSPDGSSNRNPPEKCPRPLYSRDSTQEHQEIPQENQSEGLIVVKVEDEEEPYMMGDDPCKEEEISPEISTEPEDTRDTQKNVKPEEEEGGHMKTKKEETPIESITDGQRGTHGLEKCPNVFHNDETEDDEVTSNSSNDSPITPNLHPVVQSSYLPSHGGCHSDHSPVAPSLEHREGEMLPCSDSGEHLAEKSELASYQGALLTQKMYSCSERGECLNTENLEHPKTHSADKPPYFCVECGKCFTSKTCLAYHERTHNGEKPFSCSECGRCFTQKGHLISHQQTHTGEKPYSCSECGRCFTQRSNLLKHQRTHTGVKPYSCPECGKCFNKRGNLTAHQRTHLGDKPYSCSECRKCFTKKSYLIYHHYKTHTGDTPFSCSECGKGFTQKEDLISHQETHTAEKPYSCMECGKGFTRKSTLGLHKRVHTGEKPYPCTECGKAFAKKASLMSHLSSHQKQEVSVSVK